MAITRTLGSLEVIILGAWAGVACRDPDVQSGIASPVGSGESDSDVGGSTGAYECPPQFDARAVAVTVGGPVVLGTATPDLQSVGSLQLRRFDLRGSATSGRDLPLAEGGEVASLANGLLVGGKGWAPTTDAPCGAVVYLLRLDARDDVAWQLTESLHPTGEGCLPERGATTVAAASDGGFALVRNTTIQRHLASGGSSWTFASRIDPDYRDIAVAPTGETLAIVATEDAESQLPRAAVMSVDPTGHRSWSMRLEGVDETTQLYATSIAIDVEGRVGVVGTDFDAETGTAWHLQWQLTLDGVSDWRFVDQGRATNGYEIAALPTAWVSVGENWSPAAEAASVWAKAIDFDGSARWRQELAGEAPAVASDTDHVYVVTRQRDEICISAELSALDGESGEIAWSVRIDGTPM